jgi:hypothetical protein
LESEYKDIYDAIDSIPGAWYYLHAYPLPNIINTDAKNLYYDIKNKCKMEINMNNSDTFYKNLFVMRNLALIGWDKWIDKHLKNTE